MATANVSVTRKTDWLLANPWCWVGAGFALTLWSWLWTVVCPRLVDDGAVASDNRIIVLALGLLCLSVGVWQRYRDRQAVHGNALLHNAARLAMAAVFTSLGLIVSILLVLTFVLAHNQTTLRTGPLLLAWITVTPASWFAARRAMQFRRIHPLAWVSFGISVALSLAWLAKFFLPDQIEWSATTFTILWALFVPASWFFGARAQTDFDDGETSEVGVETGALMMLAALICFTGSMTLFADPADPTDWDTMRVFLRVFCMVCIYASALALFTTSVRRLMISLLITIHFMGIASAVLSAPPYPWIVLQAWLRVFRPYLEFVYLTNAYHFYAPEPGPSSYLWFRLIYETPDEVEHGWWYKVPSLDENGRLNHPVALEYQRLISLTEQSGPTEASPPQNDPIYMNRLKLVPPEPDDLPPGPQYRIPLHRIIGWQLQLTIPNREARWLFQSCARHVAHKYATHSEQPTWKFKSVKIYRVTHEIHQIGWLQNGMSATDPETYRAYYMGHYDATGTFIDDDDPYLYWLLPNKRDETMIPNSAIKSWVRLHAGDPMWVRPKGQLDWVAHPPPPRQAPVPDNKQ